MAFGPGMGALWYRNRPVQRFEAELLKSILAMNWSLSPVVEELGLV